MSEQDQFYMQQLYAWTFKAVIDPLHKAAESGDAAQRKARDGVYAAIRQKVLESYRNGHGAAGGSKSQPSSFRPRRQYPN